MSNKVKEQVKAMLEMQDRINRKVNPGWRDAGYEWYRAMGAELWEMLNHYGWKWWKKQTTDIDQVRLEFVDIWHFALAAELLVFSSPDIAAEDISRKIEMAGEKKRADFRLLVEDMVSSVLKDRRLDISNFVIALNTIGMTFDELHEWYMGKNILNEFRQDNGDKDGSYPRRWSDGREDNEHLAEIIKSLDSASETYREDVLDALEKAFKKR